MASVSDIRRHIKSIKSIEQITNAMKMVAAARLRKAQENATQSLPYLQKIRQLLGHAVQGAEGGADIPLMRVRDINRVGYVVFGSDKGLAGAFSSNVIKEAVRHLSEEHYVAPLDSLQHVARAMGTRAQQGGKPVAGAATANQRLMGSEDRGLGRELSGGQVISENMRKVSPENMKVVAVGRKVKEYFARRSYHLLADYGGFTDKPQFDHASNISRDVMNWYLSGELDEVYLVYTQFHSPANYKPVTIRLLPVMDLGDELGVTMGNYVLEPSPVAVLEKLLPQYVDMLIFGALLQSAASELASRMMSMSSATDNAEELINKLTLEYNKIRQANITREISEIVGGAEALK